MQTCGGTLFELIEQVFQQIQKSLVLQKEFKKKKLNEQAKRPIILHPTHKLLCKISD